MITYYEGVPVPWVAIWSEEMYGPEMESLPDGTIQPKWGFTHLTSREYGMWMLTTPDDRSGHPEFGATHSRRQREAMRDVLCQVCGEHVEGKMFWVVPNEPPHIELWLIRQVINPPVCGPCLELAREVCPHLKSTPPATIVPHAGSKPIGVTGTLMIDGVIQPYDALAKLDDPARLMMLGRQLLVEVA